MQPCLPVSLRSSANLNFRSEGDRVRATDIEETPSTLDGSRKATGRTLCYEFDPSLLMTRESVNAVVR